MVLSVVHQAVRALPPPSRLRVIRAKAAVAFAVRRTQRQRQTALGSYVAGGTSMEGRGRTVAYRRHLAQAVADEHDRDPSLVTRSILRGGDHLDAALASPRGVIFATLHSAAMFGAIRHVVGRGTHVHVTAGPWFWKDGVWIGGAEHRKKLDDEGMHLVPSDQIATALPPVLHDGGTCMLMFDVPGKKPVRLGGKQAYVQAGLAKLSVMTGALVLPGLTYVEGTRLVADIPGPAIDPERFEGTRAERIDAVLAAAAAVLDRGLSARPQLWAAHTSVLWPDTVEPYLWAFDG